MEKIQSTRKLYGMQIRSVLMADTLPKLKVHISFMQMSKRSQRYKLRLRHVFLGHVICCDKQATAPQCFRIGSMGDINEDDIRALTTSIRNVCGDMRIELPLSIPIY